MIVMQFNGLYSPGVRLFIVGVIGLVSGSHSKITQFYWPKCMLYSALSCLITVFILFLCCFVISTVNCIFLLLLFLL